jgi:hypothetical protein
MAPPRQKTSLNADELFPLIDEWAHAHNGGPPSVRQLASIVSSRLESNPSYTTLQLYLNHWSRLGGKDRPKVMSPDVLEAALRFLDTAYAHLQLDAQAQYIHELADREQFSTQQQVMLQQTIDDERARYDELATQQHSLMVTLEQLRSEAITLQQINVERSASEDRLSNQVAQLEYANTQLQRELEQERMRSSDEIASLQRRMREHERTQTELMHQLVALTEKYSALVVILPPK